MTDQAFLLSSISDLPLSLRRSAQLVGTTAGGNGVFVAVDGWGCEAVENLLASCMPFRRGQSGVLCGSSVCKDAKSLRSASVTFALRKAVDVFVELISEPRIEFGASRNRMRDVFAVRSWIGFSGDPSLEVIIFNAKQQVSVTIIAELTSLHP